MGLLILDAQVRECVNDRARLDLELPRQFVYTDLTHRWEKINTRHMRLAHFGALPVMRAATAPNAMVPDSLPGRGSEGITPLITCNPYASFSVSATGSASGVDSCSVT